MSQKSGAEAQNMRRLYEAFCVLETADEAELFVADIMSAKEIDDLAQRLEVATLLKAGVPYTEVTKTTGASSTTVSRVSKCLKGESGGYRLVLERLDTEK